MFESDRRYANEHASKWIRNEQTSYQLRVFRSELGNFEEFENDGDALAEADHPLGRLGGKAYLDLVDGGTECICERCKETVHDEDTRWWWALVYGRATSWG